MKLSVRKVKYIDTLVYFDGPQLILLTSGKSRFLGVAVPSQDRNRFLVVSVADRDWRQYLNEATDLHYLFSYPKKRSFYYAAIVDFMDKVVLTRFDEAVSASHLPEPGFFASEHTTKLSEEIRSTDPETLLLNGQWELNEFGRFHQKYSDIYSFAAAIQNWTNVNVLADVRNKIESAFDNKPLRGGGSYLGLFNQLERHLPVKDRLRLSKIQKASPGKMEMSGRDALFSEVEDLVLHYLEHRLVIDKSYYQLHQFLQKGKLLPKRISDFREDDEHKPTIVEYTNKLVKDLGVKDFEAINELCHGNTLGIAKVSLALYRRVEGASIYFAQGRVSFEND